MEFKNLWPSSWHSFLNSEMNELLQNIFIKLKKESETNILYPPLEQIFHAFQYFPPQDTKLVILGQDPYHQHGQAMGLSFSVPKGVKIPPSLRNVFKEIMEDCGLPYPNHGNLKHWAEQGVLLLNSVLTVKSKTPGSHKNWGWETWTDHIIKQLSEENEHMVFMLWGNFARQKKELIDAEKHLVLESAHPSPLAGKKFMGNKHFSQANEYLNLHNKKMIDWKLD